MVNRQDWLDAGLAILVEQGAPGLTLERLVARMAMTKGSFYHHFAGVGAFQDALLEHVEQEGTEWFITRAQGLTTEDPYGRLRHLLDLVLSGDQGSDLQVAVRAWAAQDPRARAVQERIDRTRLDYLQSVLSDGDPDRARRADDVAHLLYLVVVGARHVVPPVPADDLHRLCDLVSTLAGRS